MKHHWKTVPAKLQYLHAPAEKYGVRGLTSYGSPVPYTKYVSAEELAEVRTIYETIDQRGDVEAIIEWCHSVETGSPANDAREHIRGLLLLFERLGNYELAPFNDGHVRYRSRDDCIVFDWTRLPPEYRDLIPWMKKFEHLRTEIDVYNYAADADEDQRRELLKLKALLERDNRVFADWCNKNARVGKPVMWEAFQAGWMLLMVDFVTWEKNPDGTLKYPG